MKICQPSAARYNVPTTFGFKGHDIRKKRAPAFSLGVRLHDKDAYRTPAPNQYKIPSVIGGQDKSIRRAPAYSLRKRTSKKEPFQTPAPNAYSLQNHRPGKRAPAFSMSAKLKDLREFVECWWKLLGKIWLSKEKSKIVKSFIFTNENKYIQY